MRLIYCVFVSALVVGCSNANRLGGSPNLMISEMGALPAPDGTKHVTVAEYRIAPLDKISITVFGLPDLSLKDVQVDAGGMVAFPLAGSIQAGGMTTTEMAAAIGGRLRGHYLRDPHVTVNLIEPLGQLITVEGAVEVPGLYPVVPQMTLLQAFASARGAADNANPDDVVVFRTVEGQRYAALYRIDDIRRGRYDDPRVYANDVIVVGESPSRRLFDRLVQAAPLFTTPLIILLQNN